uniref:Topoisomerase 6 subunit A/Spo11 TOPRIM domain-containing protein n=1 Tax=Timema bartmani TaxID=61472 RepID=A0A7R9I2S9_9NEOP|nr:unnamed protein product [Timema bartmani]
MGLTLDSKLTWRLHCTERLTKARQRLGVLGPLLNRRSALSTRNGLTLYKQLLKQILDYANFAKCDNPSVKYPKTTRCDQLVGLLIPQNVTNIVRVETTAKFVLIVEKDATFQKLIAEDFLKLLGPCILITGKGFPDMNTRLLVRRLWETFGLPTFVLTDADPHGIEIMCVYRFGSLRMCHEAEFLATPAVRWLGVHPRDVETLGMDASPLSRTDKNKLRHLSERPYTLADARLSGQVDLQLESGVKAEIEGMAHFSQCYLTDSYIPTQITGRPSCKSPPSWKHLLTPSSSKAPARRNSQSHCTRREDWTASRPSGHTVLQTNCRRSDLASSRRVLLLAISPLWKARRGPPEDLLSRDHRKGDWPEKRLTRRDCVRWTSARHVVRWGRRCSRSP